MMADISSVSRQTSAEDQKRRIKMLFSEDSWKNCLCETFSGNFVDLSSVMPSTPSTVDQKAHYFVFGDCGPWIVLTHGFGDTARSTADLGEVIASNFQCRVLVYDRFTCGRSSSPPGDCNEKYFDNMLWGLIDCVIGVNTVVSLVGESMGAMVSLVGAATHPQRVEHLILLVPPGITGKLNLDWRAKLFLTPYVGWLINTLCGKFLFRQRINNGVAAATCFHNAPREVVELWKRCQLSDVETPNYLYFARKTAMNYALHDSREFARVVGENSQCTVDIVLADFDSQCMSPPGEWQRYIPRAQVHSIPTGHNMVWENFPLSCRIVSSIVGSWGVAGR